MAIMPIINTDPVHTQYLHSGYVDFQESSCVQTLDVSHQCGVSKHSDKHWIWFSADGETRFCAIPFNSKVEAVNMLIKIIECRHKE